MDKELNNWLLKEESNLRKDRIQGNPPSKKFVYCLMVMLAVCILCAYNMPIKPSVHYRGWSSTWICRSCGYENMTGISNCGVCGNSKGKR